jgi:hypothetical protein
LAADLPICERCNLRKAEVAGQHLCISCEWPDLFRLLKLPGESARVSSNAEYLEACKARAPHIAQECQELQSRISNAAVNVFGIYYNERRSGRNYRRFINAIADIRQDSLDMYERVRMLAALREAEE